MTGLDGLPDRPDPRAEDGDALSAPRAPRQPSRLPERRTAGGDVAPPAPAPVVTPHQRNFKIIRAVLAVCAFAAVAGVVAMAMSSSSSGGTGQADSWSAFKPSTDSISGGASEIAAYVGPKYRLPTGRQIVLVSGGPLELEGVPVHIAVRHSAAAGGTAEELGGGGVLYRLCGLGPKCSIEGTPTPERGLLLYRESLELALYSFHDLKKVDNVVVFMPPAKADKSGKSPTIALAFRRGDVAGQLARPLRTTLPSPAPTPETIDQSPDTPFVKALTTGNVFSFSFTQANQDTFVYLVLDPPPGDS